MTLMPFAASVRLETSTRGEALTTSARKSGPEDLWGLAERANGTGPRPASAGRLSRRTWSCCHTRTPSTSCASAGATRSPAPLIEATDPGDPEPKLSAAGADLRTDLPRYRVYRKREMVDEPTDVRGLWRDDFVAFLIGCSFSSEEALLAACPSATSRRGRTCPCTGRALRAPQPGRPQARWSSRCARYRPASCRSR
jgi:hypothetical protein